MVWWDTGPLSSEVKPLPVHSSRKALQETARSLAGRMDIVLSYVSYFLLKTDFMISVSLLSVTMEQV